MYRNRNRERFVKIVVYIVVTGMVMAVLAGVFSAQ